MSLLGLGFVSLAILSNLSICLLSLEYCVRFSLGLLLVEVYRFPDGMQLTVFNSSGAAVDSWPR